MGRPFLDAQPFNDQQVCWRVLLPAIELLFLCGLPLRMDDLFAATEGVSLGATIDLGIGGRDF